MAASKNYDDAIALLHLNIEMFPDHFNPHDSLGEMYMLKGEVELATQSYRRSLELNAENNNAVQKLQELGAGQ